MKLPLIIFLVFIFTFQHTQAQVIDNTTTKSQQELFDYHILKQKKNKTTAWILLGSGVVMTIGGFAALENDTKTFEKQLRINMKHAAPTTPD